MINAIGEIRGYRNDRRWKNYYRWGGGLHTMVRNKVIG